jgi:outer membrane protein OmpA-like peptidoglycan-associated protein
MTRDARMTCTPGRSRRTIAGSASRWQRTALCAGLVAFGLCSLTGSRAQAADPGSAKVDAQLFRPAVDSKGFITVNSSEMLSQWAPSFGLVLTYGLDPVELGQKEAYRVEHMVTAYLQGAIGLLKKKNWAITLGVGIPIGLWRGNDGTTPGTPNGPGLDAQGVGDIVIHPKIRFLDVVGYPVGLALLLSVYTPSASYAFHGENSATFAPALIVDTTRIHKRIRLGVNVGLRLHKEGTFTVPGQVAGGDFTVTIPTASLTYGGAAAFNVVRNRLDLVAEVYGAVGFGGIKSKPVEGIGGIKVYLERSSYFTFGAGAGFNSDLGATDVRAFAGFVFQPTVGDRDGDGIPDDEDKCPDEPEDFDDFEDEDGCPDPDNDKDGIPDVDDLCPNEPGPKENRGCPLAKDLDRDGDGIPDAVDKCPDEPEDFDGYQDDDGCPDPDNDMDGIPDKEDLCPNDPEDPDGFEDEDGCPDPDNDKDGIPDKEDMCPSEPETVNGFEDADGCPDKGRVIVKKGSIEILDKIYFETAKAIIRPISFPILDAVAETLKGNPQIQFVEIQGHADERGSHPYNDDLTQRRADSVKRYLVDKGIEESRLSSKGYGKRVPIDPAHNAAAWEKNRRVEFKILKRSDGGALISTEKKE